VKIVLGITGGSGAQYGLRILEVLKQLGHSVELVMSKSAHKVLELEVGLKYKEILKIADVIYDEKDISAPIASGTHKNDGMVIAPCSMKTIAAIASGYTDNLIQRAADCMLKEERKLLLLFRETPLNLIHLKNLVRLKEAGATVMPAAPGFYYHPKTVSDMVDFIVAKILNIFGVEHNLFKSWDPETAKKDVDSF
jgi:flavin prenyltransferase